MKLKILFTLTLIAGSSLHTMQEFKETKAHAAQEAAAAMSLGHCPADVKRSAASSVETRPSLSAMAGAEKCAQAQAACILDEDDAAFDATGLPPELQALVKEYTLPPTKYFPAIYKHQVINIKNIGKLMAFSNQHFATTTNTAPFNILIFDISTGKLKHTLSGHNNEIRHIETMPNGLLISASRGDGTICIWNPNTGEKVSTISTPVDTAAVISDKYLAIAHGATVRIWDMQSREFIDTIPLASNLNWSIPPKLTTLPNEELLIADIAPSPLDESRIHRLHRWSAKRGLQLLTLPEKGDDCWRDFMKLSNGLIMICDHLYDAPKKSILCFYDPMQGQVLRQIFTTSSRNPIAIDADTIIWISGRDSAIQIDLKTGKETKPSLGYKAGFDGALHEISSFKDCFLLQDNYNDTYLSDPTHKICIKISSCIGNQNLDSLYITPDQRNIILHNSFTEADWYSWNDEMKSVSYIQIYSPHDTALAELQHMSTQKLIALEKLIEHLAKNPGLYHHTTKPFVMTGKTLKDFKLMPVAIQECLISQYNLVVGNKIEDDLKDSGALLCVIL